MNCYSGSLRGTAIVVAIFAALVASDLIGIAPEIIGLRGAGAVFGGVALAQEPAAAKGGQPESDEPDPSLKELLSELDATGQPRKKAGPFSLVDLKAEGRRVKSISIRINASGKVLEIPEAKFMETRLNDVFRIEGVGRDRIMLTDGKEKMTLILEKKTEAKEVKPAPPAMPSQPSRPSGFASLDFKAMGAKILQYFKSLSTEMIVLHAGLGILVFFLILVAIVMFFRKLFSLFRGDDDTAEDAVEEVFDDDYEPDEQEQERIAERLAAKERLSGKRIVDILLEEAKITSDLAEEALNQEKQTGKKAELYLAEKGFITLLDVYRARAEKYGMEFIDIETFAADENSFIQKRALGAVPYKLAQSACLFPYRINSRRKVIYFLHSSEPTSSLENDIRRQTGYYSKFALAEEKALKGLIGRMKNYYLLDEKFNIEDMMDPKKKKALKKKAEKKAQGVELVKIAFYLVASLMILGLGTWRYLINTPTARLKSRVDQCLSAAMKEDFTKSMEYLEPDSKMVMDSSTLAKLLGISGKSRLSFFRIMKVELSEDKKKAHVSWVGSYDRGGSLARQEHRNTWEMVGRNWCFAAKDDIE